MQSESHRGAHAVERLHSTGTGSGNPARLEHVVVIGRPQGESNVLLNQQDRKIAPARNTDNCLFDFFDDVRLNALSRLIQNSVVEASRAAFAGNR